MDASECFVQTELGGTHSRDQNFTRQKWKNIDEFEPIYLAVTIDTDKKRFVVFEHTINLLIKFIYPNLKTIFLVLASFVLLFFPFFLLMLSTFKMLNAVYSKIERLKISRSTGERLKSGIPDWRISLS